MVVSKKETMRCLRKSSDWRIHSTPFVNSSVSPAIHRTSSESRIVSPSPIQSVLRFEIGLSSSAPHAYLT